MLNCSLTMTQARSKTKMTKWYKKSSKSWSNLSQYFIPFYSENKRKEEIRQAQLAKEREGEGEGESDEELDPEKDYDLLRVRMEEELQQAEDYTEYSDTSRH